MLCLRKKDEMFTPLTSSSNSLNGFRRIQLDPDLEMRQTGVIVLLERKRESFDADPRDLPRSSEAQTPPKIFPECTGPSVHLCLAPKGESLSTRGQGYVPHLGDS